MADKKMSRQFLGMERHTRLSILGLFIVCVVVSVYYFYPRTLEVRSVDSFGVAFVGDAKLIIKDKITQELVKVVSAPKVSVALNGGYKLSYTPDWFELPRRLSVDVCFVRSSIASNVVLPEHVYCQTPIDKIEYMCDDHNVWTKYFSELQVADLRTYCGKDRPVPVVAGEKDDAPELPPSINYYASTNPTTNTVVNNTVDMPECDQDEILVWDNNQWNCRDQGTFIVTYPNCAPGEVLTSILGVLTCVAGSTPTLLAQNGASIVPGGIIEFGLNPLLHDTVVPQAGFDMSFIGGTSGGFIQNYIDGVSGTLHGIESRDNLFGIPGVNGTLSYSSPNVGAIPFGGEGSYMYTIDGDAGFGSSDGLGERSFGSFFPTGFQMQHNGAAGGAVINGNASSVGIFGNDVSGSSSNGSFNGVAGTLTLTNNGPTSGMLANMLLDSNDGSLRYLGNNIAGHITKLDLDSAAATGQIYVQDAGPGIIQMDMQATLGRTSIYTQAAGSFNTFSLDQAAGLGFVSNIPPVFAPLTFGVSQLGDVTFDRELRPGGNAGNAGEVLTSQGVGLPPVWTAASSGSLTAANNGLSLSGTIAQLGGPIIQNTTITNNGFDLIFDGTGNGSGKVASFLGDIDVTGTIDPTRILFSNLAGVNSPSYNPSANNNNYSMRFEEGGNLNFQSNTTNDILHLSNSGLVGIGTGTPVYNLDVVGMMNQVAVLPGGRTTNIHSGDNVIGAGIKGVGFTTQDPVTGALGYLFAGDSTSTGGAPNQAGVGLTNFLTGQNGQLFISDQTGNYAVSLQAYNGSNNVGTDWYGSTINSFVNDSLNGSSLTFEPLLLTLNNADLQLNSYQSGRDDTGSFSPLNFLYTDNAGRVLSAPTSAITGALTASNGLTRVSDDFRLGGLLTQNTTIDTAGFDIVSTQTDVDGGVLRNGLFINPSTFIDTETIAGSTYYNPVQNYEVFNGIIPTNQPDANFAGLLYADGNVLNRYLQVGINNRNINIRENDATGATGLEIVNRDMNLYAQGGAKISIQPTNVSGATVGQVLTMVGANGEAEWADAPSATAVAWSLTGNSGTTAATNFVGTTDLQDLAFRTNNIEKMRLLSVSNADNQIMMVTGGDVLIGNIVAGKGKAQAPDNTAFGQNSLQNVSFTEPNGNYNSAFGSNALPALTTGFANTAVGESALFGLTTGTFNAAFGSGALNVNNGNQNLAIGSNAMVNNTGGSFNVAIGSSSLGNSSSGSSNIAIGRQSGQNITGSNNIVVGVNSGTNIAAGTGNVVLGSFGGVNGAVNTVVIGDGAGNRRINIDGSGNIGLGGVTTPLAGFHTASTVRLAGIGTNTVDTKIVTTNATGDVTTRTLASLGASMAIPISSLTPAVAVNTIDNLNFQQDWNWNTLTGGNGLNLSSNSLTTGSVFNIANSSAAATGAIASITSNAVLGNALQINNNGAGNSRALFINSAGTVGTTALITANAVTTGTGFELNSNNTALNSVNGFFRVFNNSAPATATGLFARFQPNNTAGSGLTVLNNGNIGIGTATPGGTLDLLSSSATATSRFSNYGNTNDIYLRRAQGTIAAPTIVGSGSVLGRFIGQGYDGSTFQTGGSISFEADAGTGAGDMPGRIVFNTSLDATVTPVERMRISNAGNVGISNNAPGFLLHVGSATTTSGTSVARFENAGGTCTITPNVAGGITCTSDIRFKKNITDLPYASVLDQISGIAVKEYNMKADAAGTQKQIGFIAQNLENIFPSMVMTDSEGKKSVSYAAMTPILTAAVNELNVKVDSNQVAINSALGIQTAALSTAITNIQNQGDSVEEMLAALNANDQNFLTQFDALLDSVAVQQDSISELLAALSDLRLDVESLTTRVATLEQNQKKELTGRVKIKKGDTKATIDFASSFDTDPIITLTPYNFVDGKYAVSNLSKGGFEIKLSVEQDESVTFDWRAVEASGADSSSDSSGGSGDDSDSSDDSSSDDGDGTTDTPPTPTPGPTPETDPGSGSTEGNGTDTNTGSDSGSGDIPTE